MLDPTIAKLRIKYARAALTEAKVARDPLRQFRSWFDDVVRAELPEANAMALATASPEGIPSVRMVLLKGFDDRGFVFFTNYESRKAGEIERNPRGALLFYWPGIERQVRVEGMLARVTEEESREYFFSRPRESRLGAWASRQSSVLDGREALEAAYERLRREYEGKDIPLPPFWGGYRLSPSSLEFWQRRPNRLHDRIRYRRSRKTWIIERLSP